MLLIDFQLSPRQSFARGFLKGLGAPVVLFGRFDAPRFAPISPIVPPNAGAAPSGLLAGDWSRVGGDLRLATQRYGQENPAAK